MDATLFLGIDVGSTTVKVAILDSDNNVLFSDYERHFANIRETLLDLMTKARAELGDRDLHPMITVLLKKSGPYETEEGCLSLTGVRKTTRYREIEVEYRDMSWTVRRQKLSGWTAQICQHELDHLKGIII